MARSSPYDEVVDQMADKIHRMEWGEDEPWPCQTWGHLETEDECTKWHRQLAQTALDAALLTGLVVWKNTPTPVGWGNH